MLDYTRLAFQKTFDDFKNIGHWLGVFTQVLYIAYLVYSIIVQAGAWWIKTVFLGISVAYFVFYLIVHYCKKAKLEKTGKKVIKYARRIMKLFDLIVAFYSIAITVENEVNPTSVILLAMMICFWVLQVVFDIIVTVIENRVNLIVEGVKADWEEIRRPMDSVSNFVKKITGKEVEPEKEKTKQRIWLDEKITASRKEKREAKRAQKEAEKAEKIAKKAEAKQAKNASPDNSTTNEKKSKQKKEKKAKKDKVSTIVENRDSNLDKAERKKRKKEKKEK